MAEQDYRPPRQPLVPLGTMQHHLADMTATFAADLTLAEAQAKLAEANQWLPIDGESSRELGELAESNSTGPLRLGYGAWRDLILGCQFLNGTGELITAGARTMKNVAGYDLAKFIVGAHRIFGRIVTLTTRTYRRPEGALLAMFDRDSEILSTLLTTPPARPQWSMLTRDWLLCGYLGDARTISFYESELPAQRPLDLIRQSLEEDTALRARVWWAEHGNGVLSFRASVPPSKVRQFVSDAQLTRWVADAAFGVVLGSIELGHQSALLVAADDAGGSVVLLDDWGHPLNPAPDPSVQALLERLKRAFDPSTGLRPLPVPQAK